MTTEVKNHAGAAFVTLWLGLAALLVICALFVFPYMNPR